MQRHRIKFKYQGQNDDDNITMAFSKKCVDQRKDWLTTWMETTKIRKEMGLGEDVIYNKNVRSISYTDFINKELVLFSNLDNSRSIPSLVDGLKPGQRKVIFTCLKEPKDGLKQTKLNFKTGGSKKAASPKKKKGKKGSDSEDEESDDPFNLDSDSDMKPVVLKKKSPPKRKKMISDSEDDGDSDVEFSPKKKSPPKK